MALRSQLKVDFVDLCRDSAKIESKLSSLLSLLHRLQREVGELRNEVAAEPSDGLRLTGRSFGTLRTGYGKR